MGKKRKMPFHSPCEQGQPVQLQLLGYTAYLAAPAFVPHNHRSYFGFHKLSIWDHRIFRSLLLLLYLKTDLNIKSTNRDRTEYSQYLYKWVGPIISKQWSCQL